LNRRSPGEKSFNRELIDLAMTERPNILLFIADGMQAATVEPGSSCRTPNMDRLAARGRSFRRAYCPSPTCSPSRASLMTGLLPHNHGVLEVEHGRDKDQCVLRADKPHFAQRLSAAGYQTGYFGKWHVERSNDLAAFGWQESRVKSAETVKHLGKGDDGGLPVDPGLSRWHEGPAEGYRKILHYGVTDVAPPDRYAHATVDQALEYLGKCRDSEQPWLGCVSFSEPNEALVVSRETFERYDLAEIDLPENRHEDFSDKPNLYRREKQIASGVTDAEWRMARACYYGRITELDDQLGRLLDWLERIGEAENTMVVVTADHGRYVGARGFDAHNFGAFEDIYRVPMIVAGAGVAETNSESDEPLVMFHDLCPTLIEIGGGEVIDETDAQSFAEILRGEEGNGNGFDEAYAEYHGTRFPLCQRVLWQGNWKFVFNGFDFDELYDLCSDPDERTNLAALPEHADRVKEMMAGVWRRAKASGDRTIVESHYFSMRFAAVGPDAG
jgi:arylsulfatase A-like enzyme